MYIVMNQFTLAPGMGEKFEARWAERNSHLKAVPGFMRFRLLKGDDTHYSSYVEWESEAHFEAWTTSEAFRQAHANAAPKEIFAGPPRLQCWEVIREEA